MRPMRPRARDDSSQAASNLPGRPSGPLRAYLYATGFITGAAVMIVEILGAKMLAPYLGTSHFVWTAQIAVTLVALAGGYYAGGRLADARPDLRLLYLALVLAAAYLVGGMPAVRPAADWALGFSLPVAALVVSAILFLPPLSLLAMTVPFFIRALAASVERVGSVVGRLSAINTVGSFAGTLLVGYVLIPLLPNTRILYVTAVVLLAVAALFFVVWGRRGPLAPVALTLVVAVAGAGVGTSRSVPLVDEDRRLLHHGNSNFGELQVTEDASGSYRSYLNDLLPQNNYDPKQKKSTSAFTYVLHALAETYAPRLRTALCIGMGVGIVPMTLARAGVQVEVVEINPAVVPVAERFFDFDPRLASVVIDDGRHFVRTTPRRYDAVVLDAFLGDSSPSHLMTREAFAQIARILEPDGVLVINSFGELVEGQDFFSGSLAKTLQAVFPEVRMHHIGAGNIYFVASRRTPLSPVRQPTLEGVHEAAAVWVHRSVANGGVPELAGGLVLTDDFNPADFHDADHRERVRRSLSGVVRN